MPGKVIWRLREVLSHTGLSRSSVYKKISLGEFPRQFRLGDRAVGWDSDSVEAWIQSKIDASRPGDGS